MMMRLLFVAALLFILAGVFVEARYMDSPYSRLQSLLENSEDSYEAFVPQRQLRQVIDLPLPCRWKLCASYY